MHYFLLSSLLLFAPFIHAETVSVSPWIIDVPPPEVTPEKQAELKQQALATIKALEASAPRSVTFRSDYEAKKPESLTRSFSAHISAAHTEGQWLYKVERKREHSTYAFDGTSHRNLEYTQDKVRGFVPAGSIVVEEEADQAWFTLMFSGMEHIPSFTRVNLYGETGVGISNTLDMLGTESEHRWDVVDVQPEVLVIRIFDAAYGGHSQIIGIDRLHGGNVVRREVVEKFGTPDARIYSRLAEYELAEVGAYWLPRVLKFESGEGEKLESRIYTFTWEDAGATRTPADFWLEFPPGAIIRDETTTAARATRMRHRMQRKVGEWNSEFWGWFE